MASRRKWRFLETPPESAFLNMALDEAILRACAHGKASPTVRFYRWRSPSLSIGYAQPLARTVEVERCAAEGIPIVRRPTGGRAVLHDQELTYGVVWPADGDVLPRDLLGSYKAIGRALLRGLRELGVRGQMAPPEARPRHRGGRSMACFMTSSAYEIVAEGKKVIGSAQRRERDAALQQGSILLEADVERLFSLLRTGSQAERLRWVEGGMSAIGSLNELVGRALSYEEVRDAFRTAFQAELGGEWVEEGLSEEEEATSQWLVTERYGTAEWTNRR